MGKFIDITRQQFGRLTVIEQVSKTKQGQSQWLCRCNCKDKNEIIVLDYNLTNGHTQSCGCLIRNGNNTKHGHSKKTKVTKTYRSWQDMKKRCTNPKNNRYEQYSTRGIVICKHWMEFHNFLTDMGECPDGHSLDRIDNDDNYYPKNCRWATPKQQARNTSKNHLKTHNGKTQCITEWAEQFSICQFVLRSRIKLGWSMKKALTTPVKKYKERKRNG